MGYWMLFLQLLLSASALNYQNLSTSGLTVEALAHPPKDNTATREEAFDKDSAVQLNAAKARETRTPPSPKVDAEGEFQPPSLKVIGDSIVKGAAVEQNQPQTRDAEQQPGTQARTTVRTMMKVQAAVQEGVRQNFKRLQTVSRYGVHGPLDTGTTAIDGFGCSLVCVYLAVFMLVHCVQAASARDPSKTTNYRVLFLWGAMAVSCFLVVFWQYGSQKASVWLDGYLLEMVFMLDNIFVLVIISKPFGLPWRTTYLALVATVVFQLICSAIFYLLLGEQLASLEWLQYILGVSLLWAAYQAVAAGEHEEFDIMETQSVQLIKHYLGDRLVAQPNESDKASLAVVMTNREGKTALTMGGFMLLCLFVADFVLEIDVTLSKIDELQDRYQCLSSSVLAAFTMPDIFRLTESLFRRYSGLKYGVGLVLVFIGAQMLLHRLFTIPALLGVAVIVAMMCLSIVASAILSWTVGEDASASLPTS